MPTEIVRLLWFDGPNIYGPQPGVLLQVRSDKDRSRRIKDALKDGAQSIGLVLGYPDVSAAPQGQQHLISASFVTPTPAIGAELARYVVAGLNAREANDEDWDAEEPLWALLQRQRAEALPIAALQLAAEAARQGVPWFLRPDGALQLGYGARGYALDREQLGQPDGASLPWSRLGPVPIVAVTGGAGRDLAARRVAEALERRGQAAGLALAAGFEAARALLAEPTVAAAVIGLDEADLLGRGLPFERCLASAVVDLPDKLPASAADSDELARALGLPSLVAAPGGRVVLNADVGAIAELAAYAPCPVVLVSAHPDNELVAAHRAAGGQALFVREGRAYAARGEREEALSEPLGAGQPTAELAALALLGALDEPG